MSTSGVPGERDVEFAVPTLKVMRLQKPDLHMPVAGSLDNRCLLGSAMCLPDSFGVIHVGETFTAYLGVLNVSRRLHVTRLTVSAQLQTPSQRWQLASSLDAGNSAGGVDIAPDGGIDTIVSQALEEAGQHILRVEVGYGGSDGSVKTLRKFYRFQVTNPLTISELTTRTGDASCFVSISLENNAAETKGGALTICGAEFDPAPGLSAEPIVATKALHKASADPAAATSSEAAIYPKATDLYDESGRLEAGSSVRYLFKVTATSEEAVNRGIAAGDELGKAIFTWRKAMGEMGRMASSPILCPMATPYINPSDPVATMTGGDGKHVVHMHGSGLSVDVATAAAKRAASTDPIPSNPSSLENILPVTVEPIEPPKLMHVGIPQAVQFLVVNHSNKGMALQLQFQLEHMGSELMVCGPSYINLGDVPGSGGSASATVRFLSLHPGLHRVQGCCIVDLNTDQQVPQPPLFSILVEPPEQ